MTVTLASGLRLSFAERGVQSDSVALFLPGPTDAWRSYAPVLDLLPRDIRAIAISARGHGDSDKPDAGYAVDDFAGDVVELLDAFDITRAVLAAHSGSCLAARRVALDHPERVAGLLLEASPTTLAADPALVAYARSEILTLQDPIDPDFVRSFVGGTSSDGVASALVDVVVEDALKVPARVWRSVFANLLDYDDLAELRNVSCATRLIWGDRDSIVSRAMQDGLVALIPDAELLVYPSVGHTPRWEETQRFADDVAAFVQRVR